jgi:hypothetical protein
MPHGNVLLVSARCGEYGEEGYDNARLYAANGSLRRTAHIGDGIEHLLSNMRGDVWVGYFDEGVFGNVGRDGSGTRPFASSGFVRFNNRLELEWEFTVDRARFPDEQSASREQIADLDSLNVTEERALAFSYPSWSVLEVKGETVRSIFTDTRGCSTLVALDDEIALHSNEGSGIAWMGSISADSFEIVGSEPLTLPWGKQEDGRWANRVCRGPVIHVFHNGYWSKYQLE